MQHWNDWIIPSILLAYLFFIVLAWISWFLFMCPSVDVYLFTRHWFRKRTCGFVVFLRPFGIEGQRKPSKDLDYKKGREPRGKVIGGEPYIFDEGEVETVKDKPAANREYEEMVVKIAAQLNAVVVILRNRRDQEPHPEIKIVRPGLLRSWQSAIGLLMAKADRIAYLGQNSNGVVTELEIVDKIGATSKLINLSTYTGMDSIEQFLGEFRGHDT